MTRFSTACIGSLVALLLSHYAGADAYTDPLKQLRVCARITNTAERMRCFEALGKQVLASDRAAAARVETAAQPEPGAVSSAATVATPRSPTLPSELGGGKYSQTDPSNMRQDRGKVISCRQDPNYNYSFVFDNGQVWRQTDGRQFRKPTGCHFVAIISKDGFGYKMHVEGTTNQYRVRRIR